MGKKKKEMSEIEALRIVFGKEFVENGIRSGKLKDKRW